MKTAAKPRIRVKRCTICGGSGNLCEPCEHCHDGSTWSTCWNCEGSGNAPTAAQLAEREERHKKSIGGRVEAVIAELMPSSGKVFAELAAPSVMDAILDEDD